MFVRIVYLLIIVAACLAPDAIAQIQEDNALEKLVDTYRDQVVRFEPILTGLAVNLFKLLVIIELTWAFMKLVKEGAGLNQWAATLLSRIFFIGFFIWLLNNGGFADIIVDSFRQAAGIAASQGAGIGDGSELSPSDVFESGLLITDAIYASVGFNFESVGLVLVAVIVIISFAIIASVLIMALVEFYFVTSAGVFLLGFGGSRWTKDIALKYMTYTLGIGIKLFIIQLVVAVGQTIITNFADSFETGANSQVFIVIGVTLVYLALVLYLPNIVSGLVSGVSPGGSGSVLGAAALTAGAIGASAVAATKTASAGSSLAKATASAGGAAASAGGTAAKSIAGAGRAAGSTLASAASSASQSAGGGSGGGGRLGAAARFAGSVAGHTAEAYGKAAKGKVQDAISQGKQAIDVATRPSKGSLGGRAATAAAAKAGRTGVPTK